MLTELLEVKQLPQEVQFLKTEATDLRSLINSGGAEPDSQRREVPHHAQTALQLTNEEQFDGAEAALKEGIVRQKMVINI